MQRYWFRPLLVIVVLLAYFWCLRPLTVNAAAAIGPAPFPVYSVYEPKPTYVSTDNIYQNLKVPTQITKIGDTYFIVDCYHDQVIYSRDLLRPLPEWKVLTKSVKQPHTIASDGSVYLVDDTENNRILVFEKVSGRLTHTQTLNSIGNRPHYIVYDTITATFYAWSSLTGEMYLLKRQPGTNQVYIEKICRIDELSGIYIRSFTILGDHIYFPSGNNAYITVADKNTFQVVQRYPVDSSIAGMAQIVKIQDYYYITVSTNIHYEQHTATLLRTTDLNTLATGGYEDVFQHFGESGTPYYISQFDQTYYLTHHRTNPGVWSFRIDQNEITSVRPVH